MRILKPFAGDHRRDADVNVEQHDCQPPEVQLAVDELPKSRNGYMKYGLSRPPSTRLVGPTREPRGGTPLRGSFLEGLGLLSVAGDRGP
jgi:hypothetical protein